MIKVYPFPALRPCPEFVESVAAKSTGTESDEELFAQLENNPFSYLHIVKPYMHFGDIYARNPVHYPFAKNYFRQMLEQQVLVSETEPCIYIYKQTYADGSVFEGVVLGVSALDYLSGAIKKHENTRTEKEERLMKHVATVGAVGEPVLLSLENDTLLNKWIESNKSDQNILFNFSDRYNNRHEVWKISEPREIQSIQEIFAIQSALYIADGHHRIAASSAYCAHMHNSRNWTPEQMFFMAFVISEKHLQVKSFHRLVTDAIIPANFIQSLENSFQVIQSANAVKPKSANEIGMYYNKNWYSLTFLRDADEKSNVQQKLTLVRFEREILQNLLEIRDSKTDKRLDFVNGDTSLSELELKANEGKYQLIFTFFPNTISEIKAIADNNLTMPPKSTWIEPKMLTGMLIQRF